MLWAPMVSVRSLRFQMHAWLHAKISTFGDFHLFDLASATVRLEQRSKVSASFADQEGNSHRHLLWNDSAGRLPLARATRRSKSQNLGSGSKRAGGKLFSRLTRSKSTCGPDQEIGHFRATVVWRSASGEREDLCP